MTEEQKKDLRARTKDCGQEAVYHCLVPGVGQFFVGLEPSAVVALMESAAKSKNRSAYDGAAFCSFTPETLARGR